MKTIIIYCKHSTFSIIVYVVLFTILDNTSYLWIIPTTFYHFRCNFSHKSWTIPVFPIKMLKLLQTFFSVIQYLRHHPLSYYLIILSRRLENMMKLFEIFFQHWFHFQWQHTMHKFYQFHKAYIHFYIPKMFYEPAHKLTDFVSIKSEYKLCEGR